MVTEGVMVGKILVIGVRLALALGAGSETTTNLWGWWANKATSVK